MIRTLAQADSFNKSAKYKYSVLPWSIFQFVQASSPFRTSSWKCRIGPPNLSPRRPAHNPRRLPCSGRLQVDHQQVGGVNMIKMRITTTKITTSNNNKTSTTQVGKMARPILKASLSSEYLAMERRSTWIWKTTGEKMKKIQILKKSLIFSVFIYLAQVRILNIQYAIALL